MTSRFSAFPSSAASADATYINPVAIMDVFEGSLKHGK